LANAIEVLNDFVVPDADDAITEAHHPLSRCLSYLALRLLTAVELDN
jgi:hypothetical protein